MSDDFNRPGEIVSVRSVHEGLEKHQTFELLRTKTIRVVQIIVPSGEIVPTHEAEGEVVLQCLQGRVQLAAMRESCEVAEGELTYLTLNEPFSITATENSTLLVTFLSPTTGRNLELIGRQ